MLQLATVILRHTQRGSLHYDWLLCDPLAPHGLLVSFRMAVAPTLAKSRWELTAIAPHRRRYLTYQGPITGGRGSVVRVDKGFFSPSVWTPHRRIIDLQLRLGATRVELRRVAEHRWMASATGWQPGGTEADDVAMADSDRAASR